MTEEQRLIEKLQRIEALFAGAATPGERQAAGLARDRIRSRLQEQQQTDPPVEYSFKLRDRWSHRLLTALLRRYQIRPYRYRGQRYTTIMARVPRRFVHEVLWPEFMELNQTLASYLQEVTQRVISQGINADTADVEIAPGQLTPGIMRWGWVWTARPVNPPCIAFPAETSPYGIQPRPQRQSGGPDCANFRRRRTMALTELGDYPALVLQRWRTYGAGAAVVAEAAVLACAFFTCLSNQEIIS